MTTAAIYARKSNQDGREGVDKSVQSQIAACRTFAEKQGWTVADEFVFVDDGISGADFTAERKGFTALDALLTPTRSRSWRAPFEVLLLSDDERTGRDLIGNLRFEQKVAQANVQLWDVARGRDITIRDSKDKMGRAFAAGSAESLIDETSGRVRRAQKEDLWDDGFVVGGRVFGYTNESTKSPAEAAKMKHPVRRSRRVINEREAAAVRRIFDLFVSGRSFKDIRDTLGKEHLPAPRGRGWTTAGVKHILLRSDYMGLERRGATVRVRREDEHGKTRWFQIPSDKELEERESPAIITRDIWDAAQARLAGNRRAKSDAPKTRTTSKNFNLLSGMLQCGRCHGPLIILNFHATKGSPAVKQLVCANYHRRGSKGETVPGGRYCDSGARIAYTDLEQTVITALTGKNLRSIIETFYRAEQDRRSAGVLEQERATLTADLARLTREASNLTQAIRQARELGFTAAVPPLLAELADAEAQKAKTQARLDGLEEPALDWTPDWLGSSDDPEHPERPSS
jgi:site-specific DNA recombinase